MNESLDIHIDEDDKTVNIIFDETMINVPKGEFIDPERFIGYFVDSIFQGDEKYMYSIEIENYRKHAKWPKSVFLHSFANVSYFPLNNLSIYNYDKLDNKKSALINVLNRYEIFYKIFNDLEH